MGDTKFGPLQALVTHSFAPCGPKRKAKSTYVLARLIFSITFWLTMKEITRFISNKRVYHVFVALTVEERSAMLTQVAHHTKEDTVTQQEERKPRKSTLLLGGKLALLFFAGKGILWLCLLYFGRGFLRPFGGFALSVIASLQITLPVYDLFYCAKKVTRITHREKLQRGLKHFKETLMNGILLVLMAIGLIILPGTGIIFLALQVK
jgi:hypothetical protein